MAPVLVFESVYEYCMMWCVKSSAGVIIIHNTVVNTLLNNIIIVTNSVIIRFVVWNLKYICRDILHRCYIIGLDEAMATLLYRYYVRLPFLIEHIWFPHNIIISNLDVCYACKTIYKTEDAGTL